MAHILTEIQQEIKDLEEYIEKERQRIHEAELALRVLKKLIAKAQIQ